MSQVMTKGGEDVGATAADDSDSRSAWGIRVGLTDLWADGGGTLSFLPIIDCHTELQRSTIQYDKYGGFCTKREKINCTAQLSRHKRGGVSTTAASSLSLT